MTELVDQTNPLTFFTEKMKKIKNKNYVHSISSTGFDFFDEYMVTD